MKGSLGEFASLPGTPSEPVLRDMIRDHVDFPIVERGTNGRAYVIDFDAAWNFIRSIRAKEEEALRARADEVRQYGLDMLGGDSVTDQQRQGLSSAERKALMEEELFAIRVSEKRGELIRKTTVEAAFTAVMSLISQQGRTLAARLAKRTELTREQIALIERIMESDLAALADIFEEMGGGSGNAARDPDDPAI